MLHQTFGFNLSIYDNKVFLVEDTFIPDLIDQFSKLIAAEIETTDCADQVADFAEYFREPVWQLIVPYIKSDTTLGNIIEAVIQDFILSQSQYQELNKRRGDYKWID
jgi:hypothetical protein